MYAIVCPECGNVTGLEDVSVKEQQADPTKEGGHVCIRCNHFFPKDTDFSRYFRAVIERGGETEKDEKEKETTEPDRA